MTQNSWIAGREKAHARKERARSHTHAPSWRWRDSVYLIQRHRSRDFLAVWFRPALSVVYDQVDGHLAFQAADVPVTEIITQLVYLQGGKEERGLHSSAKMEKILKNSKHFRRENIS